MKLELGDYEVEVKAKDINLGHQKFNQNDTMYFLNELSCFLSEATRRYEETGYHALSSNCDEMQQAIYNQLKEIGFYN